MECIADIKDGLATLVDIYGNLDNVAILTLAPELHGACDVIRPLTEQGITVSLGAETFLINLRLTLIYCLIQSIINYMLLMMLGIFIHSFIMSISIVPLQGDYSEALPIPVRPKRKVLDERKKS